MVSQGAWRKVHFYVPLAACLYVFAVARPGAAADQVNLSLDLAKSGKHTGIYVAIDKGYFKAANIELSITTGRGSGLAVTNVETGNSQFGLAAFSNVVINRSKGSPVKSVMLLGDLSPFAVASLKDRLELKSPKSLEGHSMAAPQGSAIRALMPIFMKINGVDTAKVKLVNLAGALFIQALLRGDVDVTSAFENEVGVALEMEAAKAGKQLSVLRMRDWGMDTYGTSFITTDKIIRESPDLVRRMVGALVKGYTFMTSHPEEAVQILLRQAPELPVDITREQVLKTVALSKTPLFTERAYGWAEEKKLKHTVEIMSQAFNVEKTILLSEIHTNDFLTGR